MALIEIANTDRIITITAKGAWIPGNPTYTQTVSTKVKANAKGILCDKISWVMAGCTLPAYNFVSGSSSTPIETTATKTKETIINKNPLRKGDKGECTGLFTLIAVPHTPLTCNCDFEITDAGQTKDRCQ